MELVLRLMAEVARLQKRYQEHRADLYVLLARADVEPTNNGSEQDLRNSVLHRKVTAGYRSDWGAEVSAIFTTLPTTDRKRGESLLEALRAIAGPFPAPVAGRAA